MRNLRLVSCRLPCDQGIPAPTSGLKLASEARFAVCNMTATRPTTSLKILSYQQDHNPLVGGSNPPAATIHHRPPLFQTDQ
jgi:hypothetical protein